MTSKAGTPTRCVIILAGGLLLAILAGCISGGEITGIIPISGGQTIEALFNSHGPVPAQDGDIKILLAGCLPNPKLKEIRYAFVFLEKNGDHPRRVQVEDVTDPEAVLLLDDTKPVLQGSQWRGETPRFPATDPRFAWLVQIVNSTRVFRFTITDSTGRQHVLYECALYPVFYKQAIAKSLGLTS